MAGRQCVFRSIAGRFSSIVVQTAIGHGRAIFKFVRNLSITCGLLEQYPVVVHKESYIDLLFIAQRTDQSRCCLHRRHSNGCIANIMTWADRVVIVYVGYMDHPWIGKFGDSADIAEPRFSAKILAASFFCNREKIGREYHVPHHYAC